jgi:hypothetical protein
LRGKGVRRIREFEKEGVCGTREFESEGGPQNQRLLRGKGVCGTREFERETGQQNQRVREGRESEVPENFRGKEVRRIREFEGRGWAVPENCEARGSAESEFEREGGPRDQKGSETLSYTIIASLPRSYNYLFSR